MLKKSMEQSESVESLHLSAAKEGGIMRKILTCQGRKGTEPMLWEGQTSCNIATVLLTMVMLLLPQRAGSPLLARGSGEGCRRSVQLKTVLSTGFHSARQQGSPGRGAPMRAARNGQSGPSSPSNDFNLAEYVEAKVESGEQLPMS
jgi:hypothetical protein